ncbi:uncharacterized protein BX663DRAFT_495790 [Cokeromyces recurvatus]|uniref:uncharacterized protein n=1 Tax=Cokeromyces recurvatus TaxID=90255 RepID=UPI0022202F8C|nr:uncharacterized protein BX663DRAFT_495790 [Cokeromyces recurvatus]KAI7907412.1 hypothetical protein BX663DRAFT_495790 [Cokeromyces recurvatus]
MSPREYTPGDIVFAKLKGYPWWPARVENDEDIPPKVLKQKGKSKGVLYTVFFYGSRDYGFFGPDCVRPFDREAVERDLKAKKFKTKDLELAIHQALDPSLLKAEEEAEAAAAAAAAAEEEENEEEEEEEEDDDDDEVMTKRKRGKGRTTKSSDKKKKMATGTKKRSTYKKTALETYEDEDDEEEDELKPKRKRTTNNRITGATKRSRGDNNSNNNNNSELDNTDLKKRRKSLSTEQEEDSTQSKRESSTVSNKSEEPNESNHYNGHIETQEDIDAFKKTPEYKRIYHIRHKLQKLVYEKKPGEIRQEDFAKISQVVKEIEESQMTFDLLRYTKIGKVVKCACSYDYGEDEYKISQRCQQLMRNWKSLILPNNNTNSLQQQQS